ncbi:hypothetical protein [Paraburkholderia caribensis]|uniref:hypothetical protein n=1 Tax=Paraburkholderia caribensis TaxID=75105 RepID=UPI001CAB2DAC|nr:hypothetical protein [Paraburkholderia caribensis]GJH32065.1 hypothetical protein CBA19CS91_04930 [Paraburkholderia hospita]CAG9264592.1 conserved exported hypothetical protein [Paraburkholderia caribensis]
MSLHRSVYVRSVLCAQGMSAVLLLTTMAAAEASNLNFLNDTPMSYIKKNDMDSIKVALTNVLNTKRDGEATQWTNQGTGNSVKIHATMTPESTRHEGNKTCRRITVVLSAKGQSMNLHPGFCGTGKTDWTMEKR